MSNENVRYSELEKRSLQALGKFIVKLGYLGENAYEQFCSLYSLEEQSWPAVEKILTDLLSEKQMKLLRIVYQEWLFLEVAKKWHYLEKKEAQKYLQKRLHLTSREKYSPKLVLIKEEALSEAKLNKIRTYLIQENLISSSFELYPHNSNTSSHTQDSSVEIEPIEDLPMNFPLPKVDKGVDLARYEILEEIGSGGTGTVYKVKDTQNGEIRALKILTQIKGDQSQLRRFFREAWLLAKINHPNIVKVYDIGKEKGMVFYTMDFVEGSSLGDIIEKQPTLSFTRIVEIILKVAEAVTFAHQQNIIHRDIKPSNIMIKKDGEPILLDFGLAKMVEGNEKISQTGVILGTPVYMSPEQAAGSRLVNEQSDIYSIGVLMYEMLTGEAPFRGGNSLNIILQVLNVDPIRPRKMRANIPKDLENICLKAMQKEPYQRYNNGSALINDLRRFQNGLPVEASPPHVWHYIWRQVLKNKTLSLSVAVTLLSFIVGIIWFSYREYQLLSDLQKCTKLILNLQQISSHTNIEESQTILEQYEREFSTYIYNNRRNAAAYLGRSVCHILTRDCDNAIDDLSATIRLADHSPFHIDVLYTLRGQCYIELGKYRQALQDLKKVESSGRWLWLGSLSKDLGKYDEALKMFNYIIEHPNQFSVDSFARAHVLKAEILAKQGRFDEAYSYCNEAIGLIPYSAGSPFFAPNTAGIYQTIAEVALWQGNYEKSLENVMMSLRWFPDSERAFSLQGKIYARMGMFDASLAKHRRAISSETGKQVSHYNFACYYALKGDEENALWQLKKALEYGYRDFLGMRLDKDLEEIRQMPEFKELLSRYPPPNLSFPKLSELKGSPRK